MNKEHLIEEMLRRSGANPKKCIKCGKCSGACPAYSEMEYHPHQFANMFVNGDVDALLESDAVFKCMSCMACVERCPKGVAPGKLVEAIRLQVVRQKGQNHLKAEDVPCLLDEDIPQQAIVSAFRKYSK